MLGRLSGIAGWSAVLGVALAAGCGQPGASSGEVTCDPPCPKSMTCTADGCVAKSPPDLARPERDLASGPCSSACFGVTPYCKDGVCVPCLEDKDCGVGRRCIPLGGGTACVLGCTSDDNCQSVGLAHRVCCDGLCVDPAQDLSNCGGCGQVCSIPHSVAQCVGGACMPFSCEATWADCNQDPADGCEVHLSDDDMNCGGCGTRCHARNSTTSCSRGRCYIVACNFGWEDCDGDDFTGCEANLFNSRTNCGGCGITCSVRPHGNTVCDNAVCVISNCDRRYADCNFNPADGCEVNLFTDAENCSACGKVCDKGLVCKDAGCTCAGCDYPNALSRCGMNNTCQLGACFGGWANCNGIDADGCEVHIADDPNNCGACGKQCQDPMKPLCARSTCTDNPCNAFGLPPVAAAMGTPSFGFCWYLGQGGATCDDVCASSEGANQANEALQVLAEDCSGRDPNQPASWFFHHGNLCPWIQPASALAPPPPPYQGLGLGYNNKDGAFIGKCTGKAKQGSGTFPGEDNDTANTDRSRCLVCACSH